METPNMFLFLDILRLKTIAVFVFSLYCRLSISDKSFTYTSVFFVVRGEENQLLIADQLKRWHNVVSIWVLSFIWSNAVFSNNIR